MRKYIVIIIMLVGGYVYAKNYHYVQVNFNGGEIAEDVYARTDLDKYSASVKTLQNFLPTPQGGIVRRPGTQYIADAKVDEEIRLIPFIFSQDDAYVIEAGEEYLRFYRDGGQIWEVDSDTVLLLHMDGTNLSTTFTDDGTTGHTVSANGDAKLNTGQRVFGSASGYFDGTGDFLSVPDHANFTFAGDNFTIDTWIRFDELPSTPNNCIIYSNAAESGNDFKMLWLYNRTRLYFLASDGGLQMMQYGSWVPEVDTWYHIAVVRGWGGNANDYAITVDGAAIKTWTDTDSLADVAGTVQIAGDHSSIAWDESVNTLEIASFDGDASIAYGDSVHKGVLVLDGTGDSLTTEADNTYLNPDAAGYSDRVTVELWVKHDDHAGTEVYLGQYEDANNNWYLRHVDGSGIEFRTEDATTQEKAMTSDYEITDTEWHHVMYVEDADLHAIFIDGHQSSYLNDADALSIGSTALVVGGQNSTDYLDGQVDELRFYDGDVYSVSIKSTAAQYEYVTPDGFVTDECDAATNWGHQVGLNDDRYYFGYILDETFANVAWIKLPLVEVGNPADISIEYWTVDGSNNLDGKLATLYSEAAPTFATQRYYIFRIEPQELQSGNAIVVTMNGTDATNYIGWGYGECGGSEPGTDHRWNSSGTLTATLSDTAGIIIQSITGDPGHSRDPVAADTEFLVKFEKMGDFNGWMDEFRVSDNQARWTATFSPPTEAYPVADESGSVYEVATSYAEVDLANLHYAQSYDYIYVVHEDHTPAEIIRSDHTSWTWGYTSFASDPGDWTANNGYPRTVCFHQDRLVFAGSPAYPSRFWLSETSDYDDFDSADSDDDDSLYFNILSGQADIIKWIVSQKYLIAGAETGEWRILGDGTSLVITPTAKQAQKDSNNGSISHMPVVINNNVVYSSGGGTTLRDLRYDFDSDSFSGKDLSILANHLFKDSPVKQMAYQKTPYSIVWVISEAGDLYSLTYLEEHQVIAWASHELGNDGTEADVISITVIPGQNYEDELWLAVNRGGEYQVERMREFSPTDGIYWYLDNALSYQGASTSTVSGLSHIADSTTVTYARDYLYYGDATVSSGSITIDQASTVVVAGLDYTSLLETLPLNLETDAGNPMFQRYRIPTLNFKLHDSCGGEYQVDPSTVDAYLDIMSSTYYPGTLFDGNITNKSTGSTFATGTQQPYVKVRIYDPLPFNLDALGMELMQ